MASKRVEGIKCNCGGNIRVTESKKHEGAFYFYCTTFDCKQNVKNGSHRKKIDSYPKWSVAV